MIYTIAFGREEYTLDLSKLIMVSNLQWTDSVEGPSYPQRYGFYLSFEAGYMFVGAPAPGSSSTDQHKEDISQERIGLVNAWRSYVRS